MMMKNLPPELQNPARKRNPNIKIIFHSPFMILKSKPFTLAILKPLSNGTLQQGFAGLSPGRIRNFLIASWTSDLSGKVNVSWLPILKLSNAAAMSWSITRLDTMRRTPWMETFQQLNY